MNSDVLFYHKDQPQDHYCDFPDLVSGPTMPPRSFSATFLKGFPSDCKMPLFWIDCLILIIGSYWMIPLPMWWVPSGSWVPEDHFKFLQISKSLQNNREMNNWKMMKFNQNITICVKSKIAFSTLLLAWKFIFLGARGLNVIIICI